MKIVHIALCGPVTDNWTYQDNLLPKYHKKNGNDVVMITSKFIYNSKGNITTDTREIYNNENDIKTIRLKTSKDKPIHFRFKKYIGLLAALKEEVPDIIFVHGVQFLDIKTIVEYLKANPSTKVFVDNHADFSNSARNLLSKNFLHKIVWKRCAHLIEPYTTKFFGVLPARVSFLIDVYKIPKEKVELLVMGADDEEVEEANKPEIRRGIRNKYGIEENDFLIMTGGKIDNAKKQTLMLMQAIKDLPDERVKLIVFGSVIPELQAEVNELIEEKKIQYIGWIESEESYKYFAAADLVVFPGRHSVLWEQVVGQGIPIVVKWWDGTTHIDLGGNCLFLYEDTISELKRTINEVINNKNTYLQMKNSANSKKKNVFMYSNIAEKSIEL
ncbi:glycosyltransferase [Desemzia sp. FAM 23990]|uniref:glycosyltransferase n=1 Tax=Desemzia sp. FAM 23990 TaxID=3259520 RepID=UPI003883DD90